MPVSTKKATEAMGLQDLPDNALSVPQLSQVSGDLGRDESSFSSRRNSYIRKKRRFRRDETAVFEIVVFVETKQRFL